MNISWSGRCSVLTSSCLALRSLAAGPSATFVLLASSIPAAVCRAESVAAADTDADDAVSLASSSSSNWARRDRSEERDSLAGSSLLEEGFDEDMAWKD